MFYNTIIIYVLQNSNSSSNTNTNISMITNTITSHGLTIAGADYEHDACTLVKNESLCFMWKHPL